jgi:hypothetical protein
MQLKEKYVTDEKGNRIGVLLDIADYEKLLEQLEELDAIRTYDTAKLSDEEEISFEQALTPLVEAGLLSLPVGREDIQAISEEQLRELTQSLQKSSGKPVSKIIIEDRGAL